MAKLTGNKTADDIISGYWLAKKGHVSRADIDRAVHDELQGKSEAEIRQMIADIQRSMK